MSGLKIGLIIALGIICVILTIIIILQSNRSAGLGAVGGGSGNDSYWSKNKGNSMEGTLAKYTKIGGAAVLIIAAIINYIQ